MTSLVPTLPGSAYTDPDVFTTEQERICGQTWTGVARAADLDPPSAFRTVVVGRDSVVLVHDRDGALRAFLTVCRHRGARLCVERERRVRRLQCLTGELIAALNLAAMPDVGGAEHGLHPVALRDWLGYVRVCLADEPPSLNDNVLGVVVTRLGDVASIDCYSVEHIVLGRPIKYNVAANWKLIVENFMECYHCATFHPELTEVLPEFADRYAAQYFVGHRAEFAQAAWSFTVNGSAGTERLPGHADD
jgi:Rieske 2Fe-2S family protein